MKTFTLIMLLTLTTAQAKVVYGLQAINIMTGLELELEQGKKNFNGSIDCTVFLENEDQLNYEKTKCIKQNFESGKVYKVSERNAVKLYDSLDVGVDMGEDSHSKSAVLECQGKLKKTIFGNVKIESASCEVDDLY